MKVFVLGSSNSIGQTSYVTHLGNCGGVEILNRSIGASSSTAGLYSSHDVRAKDCDFALIDYEINEEGARKFGLKSDDDIRHNIRSLIHTLRDRGITPVMTIMPTKRGLQTPTRAEQLHLEICAELDVHTFNIADIFRHAVKEGAVWQPVMRDEFHMSALVTPVVGKALHAALMTLHGAEKVEVTREVDVVATRIIHASPLMTPERRVRRASGLREAWHGVLRQGKKMVVPIGAQERLIGVLANSGALGGFLSIEGVETAIKQLIIYFGKEKAGLYISVMSDVKQPMCGTMDGIIVSVLPQDATPTEFTLHQQPPLEGRYGEVEIECFVVASKEAKRVASRWDARPGVPFDLLQTIDLKQCARQIADISLAQSDAA